MNDFLINHDQSLTLPNKSAEQVQREKQIRDDLLMGGVEQEIANAVIGYQLRDIPFIYRTEPSQTKREKPYGSNKWISGLGSLWIGTTDVIHNLTNENGYTDQIPEVIAQWQGFKPDDDHEQKQISRTEIKQLGDGRFVRVTYIGVSEMGAFDGTIAQISLHVPHEKFRPAGGNEKQSYNIYFFGQNELNAWTLNTARDYDASDVTILGGFKTMLTFNIHHLSEVKADHAGAYRFTPLPEPKISAFLPASPQHQFELILNEETGITRDRILDVAADAEALTRLIVPQVLNQLAQGNHSDGAIQMEVDGILNHAEKIWVFDRMLEQFPREQRFALAQFVAKKIKEGHLTNWTQTVQQPENTPLVNDIVNRNTRHLLAWFKLKAPVGADLKGWIANARSFAEQINMQPQALIVKTQEDNFSREYEQAFHGVIVSVVERFIEYIAQQYLGNTLE